MGRPPISPVLLAEALAIVATGATAKDAAAEMATRGRPISWRTIYNAQTDGRAAVIAAAAPPPEALPPQTLVPYRPASRPTPTPPQPPGSRAAGAPAAPGSDPGGTGDDAQTKDTHGIDAAGTPLEVMRALLESVTGTIDKLPADSPRLGGRLSEARALAKGIAALEKEREALETPEEADRRHRAEDGETRQILLRHVERAEREAAAPRPGAPHGVCVTCQQPLAQAMTL